MHISPPAQRLLKLVFKASSAQGPLTRPRLERQSGLSRAALNGALAELAQHGLLDAQRLRLTLPGLAIAVACGARAKEARRSAAPSARLPAAVNAPIALFYRREPPRAVA
jgi:hypothetical protein